jgi:hypothetical protein
MPEAIDLLLKELKLPTFSRHYQHHQEQAIEKGYGHVRYLSGLCEQEVADRYQKRVQRWTREAGLPPGKSFANLKLANSVRPSNSWSLRRKSRLIGHTMPEMSC